MRPRYGAKPGGPAGTVNSRHRDSAETEQERQTGAGENGPGKHRRMRDGPLEGKRLEARARVTRSPVPGRPEWVHEGGQWGSDAPEGSVAHSTRPSSPGGTGALRQRMPQARAVPPRTGGSRWRAVPWGDRHGAVRWYEWHTGLASSLSTSSPDSAPKDRRCPGGQTDEHRAAAWADDESHRESAQT